MPADSGRKSHKCVCLSPGSPGECGLVGDDEQELIEDVVADSKATATKVERATKRVTTATQAEPTVSPSLDLVIDSLVEVSPCLAGLEAVCEHEALFQREYELNAHIPTTAPSIHSIVEPTIDPYENNRSLLASIIASLCFIHEFVDVCRFRQRWSAS